MEISMGGPSIDVIPVESPAPVETETPAQPETTAVAPEAAPTTAALCRSQLRGLTGHPAAALYDSIEADDYVQYALETERCVREFQRSVNELVCKRLMVATGTDPETNEIVYNSLLLTTDALEQMGIQQIPRGQRLVHFNIRHVGYVVVYSLNGMTYYGVSLCGGFFTTDARVFDRNVSLWQAIRNSQMFPVDALKKGLQKLVLHPSFNPFLRGDLRDSTRFEKTSVREYITSAVGQVTQEHLFRVNQREAFLEMQKQSEQLASSEVNMQQIEVGQFNLLVPE